MNLFYYPSKDTTIYKLKSKRELNYGNSEILEITNTYNNSIGHNLSQILIKFDIPIDTDTLESYLDFSAELNLKITHVENIDSGNFLEVFPINCEWTEGTGAGVDYDPVYGPSNWLFSSDVKWLHDGDGILGATFFDKKIDCCGNYKNINTGIELTEKTSDLRINVTEIVKYWIKNDIENNGFVLKLRNESVTNQFGSIKFFSSSTNTIYSPRLKVSYDDFQFLEIKTEVKTDTDLSGSLGSGSLGSGTLGSGTLEYECEGGESLDFEDFEIDKVVTESCDFYKTFNSEKIDIDNLEEIIGDVHVKIKNIKKEYKVSEIIKFRLGVRHKNPIRRIKKKAVYTASYYTTNELYYSIIDAETQEVIIDFDKYSRISCDKNGHFFNISFLNISPGRYYKFLILVKSDEGDYITEEQRTFHLSI
jgi:hypothetical protein